MKYKILSLLMLLLIIPIVVSADSININCPSEVDKNTEFSCEITGMTNSGITDVSFKFNLSNNLSYVTFVKSNIWNGEGDLDAVDLYGGDVIYNSFKIGTLKVKSGSSNGVISLNEVFFYEDAKTIDVNSISRSIKVAGNDKTDNSNNNSNNNGNGKNTNQPAHSSTVTVDEPEENEENNGNNIDYNNGAFLSDLKINGYNIDFRSDIFSYDVKIGNESKLDIVPSVSNESVTYKIFDNENLKDGSQIYIEVSYNDEMQIYYINVTKDKEDNKMNFAPIFIGVIVILVIINVVRLFWRKKKNEEE